MKNLLTLAVILPLVLSCDGGLTLPPEVEPGIAGTLTVPGSWASSDSVDALLLVASQIYPLDSALVVSGIFQGKIRAYPSLTGSLPFGFDTLSFRFDLPPAIYRYVSVMQRVLPNDDLNPKNYRVVGFYSDPLAPDQPLSVRVRDFELASGVNITVDFFNLPPQPF